MTIWQDGVPFDRDQYNAMTEEERRKRVEAEKQMSDEEFIKNDNGGEYFEESGEHKPLTDAQIDDAVKTATDVQNQKVDDAMAVADETQKAQKVRQQAPAQGGGQRGQSVFDIPNSFGTVLADDPKYHEEARAARERREERRDAMREARMAAAQRRQELLESGRYFDDGRGNLRLKKQFRQVAKRRGRGFYNETLPDDGSGNAAVRAAGREAFDDAMEPDLWAQAAAAQRDKKVAASRQYTQNMVAANKADMEAMEKAKSDRKVNDAKGNLSVFDGIAAAFSDMDRKFKRQGEGDITEEEVVEQPAEKFKRDALGRVTTQMNEPTKKKTGRRFVDGFVAPERIEAINSRLAGLGNNRVRITGIMARQKLGVDTKTKDGDPQFVVSGVKYDKSTGTNVPFQWVRSLQDVYRFGLENGIATGLDAASAENNVIHAISDVFGNLARRNAPSEKLRIAQANNETKEKVAQIQAQGRADRTAGRETGSGSGTGGKYDDKYAERLKGDWQDLVEQYGDEPTPEQQKKIDAARARYDRYVDSFGGGEGVPAGGDGTQGVGQPTKEEIAAEIERRKAATAQKGVTGTGNTSIPPQEQSAAGTSARQPEVAATSESVRDEIIGGKKSSATAEKPTAQTQGNDKPVQSGGEPSKSMQLREQNVKLKGPYASIPENVLAEFRDLYPDASDAEINSGRHDRVLRNIARNMGDKTTAENLDARDEQRRRWDREAADKERRAKNRAAVSRGAESLASFQREMKAFEASWDKSKRRMRAEGTYNEDYVKSYEDRKRAEIRRKFGLKEDGSEDKTGSLAHRANRGIVALDEKQERAETPHHTVAKGETLEDIAEEYNTTVDELMRLNDMDGSDEISAGESIVIPPDYDEDYNLDR